MTLIDLLIWVAVLTIVIIVLWFLYTKMTLPEPIKNILLIVGVVVVAILAIAFLLSLRGGHFSISLLEVKEWGAIALNRAVGRVATFLA